MIQLRDYQQVAIDHIRAAYSSGKRAPLFQLATGGGKTTIFGFITKSAASRGKSVWIVAHRKELLKQISDRLTDLEVPHGIIKSGVTPNPLELVQVVSIQTIAKRIAGLKRPDLIVCDESHRCLGNSYQQLIVQCPLAKILGVTATPSRLDGKPLGDIFDTIIQGPSVASLIENRYLADPIYYVPPSKLDLSGVHTVAGDYDRGELGKRLDTPTITGDAVEHYKRICPGKPALVFCVSIQHAENVANAFRNAGFRSESVDGQLNHTERDRRVAGLLTGAVQVLTSCELLNEGYDAPGAVAAILLRPTKSLVIFLQQIGRVLRPAAGKKNAIILDHCGNVMRHGFAETEREWSLEGRVKKKGLSLSEANIPHKQCPQCYAVHPPANMCPACGHVYVVVVRDIQEVDGTLEEIRFTKAPVIAMTKIQEVSACITPEQLISLGKKRGYKYPVHWANHILAARRSANERKKHSNGNPDFVQRRKFAAIPQSGGDV